MYEKTFALTQLVSVVIRAQKDVFLLLQPQPLKNVFENVNRFSRAAKMNTSDYTRAFVNCKVFQRVRRLI